MCYSMYIYNIKYIYTQKGPQRIESAHNTELQSVSISYGYTAGLYIYVYTYRRCAYTMFETAHIQICQIAATRAAATSSRCRLHRDCAPTRTTS